MILFFFAISVLRRSVFFEQSADGERDGDRHGGNHETERGQVWIVPLAFQRVHLHMVAYRVELGRRVFAEERVQSAVGGKYSANASNDKRRNGRENMRQYYVPELSEHSEPVEPSVFDDRFVYAAYRSEVDYEPARQSHKHLIEHKREERGIRVVKKVARSGIRRKNGKPELEEILVRERENHSGENGRKVKYHLIRAGERNLVPYNISDKNMNREKRKPDKVNLYGIEKHFSELAGDENRRKYFDEVT